MLGSRWRVIGLGMAACGLLWVDGCLVIPVD